MRKWKTPLKQKKISSWYWQWNYASGLPCSILPIQLNLLFLFLLHESEWVCWLKTEINKKVELSSVPSWLQLHAFNFSFYSTWHLTSGMNLRGPHRSLSEVKPCSVFWGWTSDSFLCTASGFDDTCHTSPNVPNPQKGKKKKIYFSKCGKYWRCNEKQRTSVILNLFWLQWKYRFIITVLSLLMRHENIPFWIKFS